MKRTTFLSHCSKIENHILPIIGHLKLDDISTPVNPFFHLKI
ncbi:N-terminal phage integrase SAM-like domain-containing protein [Paenibacillus barcinonensis]